MRTRLLFLLSFATTLAGCRDKAGAEKIPAAEDGIVTLDTVQQRGAGVALGVTRRLPPDTISATGTITFDAGRVSHVGPRIQGRIRRVLVDVGSLVKAGDTLAVLDSPELGAAQARWAQARANRELASRNAGRAERLARDGVVSERRRLEAAAELASRDAELAAGLQALSALGAEPDTGAAGVFVLRSPLDGEVVEKHAVVGEVVGPEANLFVVGELATVWLVLDLYETDLARVRAGLGVRVFADAYPERPYDASIALVSSVVDTTSRTVKVRVVIPNVEHRLKPGMFARAGIAVDAARDAIGLPHAAVQVLRGKEVVFVPAGKDRFRARPIVIGKPRAGGWVEVRQGLALGDTIVIAGGFALKAHMLRASFAEED